MAVIDCCTYNGETDVLEIRLNMLDEYVDEFIICEASQTFSGKPKPFYFDQQRERFAKWLHKIKYYRIDNFDDQDLWEMAHNSPNTVGASHWKQEFYIKESIKKALTHLNDDDIVFIGDCDEIWDKNNVPILTVPHKLKLRVYTYYLNNLSDEKFWGTLVGRYKDIKDECLNHLRAFSPRSPDYNGWHFTSLANGLKRKLEDSYTADSYASPQVMRDLEENINLNKDFLGRDFNYTLDETNWPQYLKDNKKKYIHLCKQF